MIKLFRISALGLALASPTLPAAMQTAAFAQPQPVAQVPPVPQPAVWSRRAAEALLAYVEAIGEEGLDPAAYRPERLRQAIAARDEGAMAMAATDIFLRLASDLSGGAVRGNGRVDWHLPSTQIDSSAQRMLMARAVADGGVAAALDSLLPTHPQYSGLRRALELTPEGESAKRQLIRTNMERWRWMPRSLGARHVIVNVPAYTAAIVDDGRVTTRHRTVVGAVRTPTPQLSATIRGVTFNPWWHVPQSIIAEMGGRFGADYEVTRTGGVINARQRPGPRNSLGRLKIEMPNDHAIYLHDTPAQALFSRPARAFSHGCIRTQNIRDFAAALLAPTGEWGRPKIDGAINTGRTSQAALAAPIPVYIAYFTAAATSEGEVISYRDIYGRDRPVREGLGATS
ncbi:L,D-transpeptidase family protein [Allosphingosinicella sp.]|jgi:murein L,D-transpeptidase YcbB/YkuD|uniref:L,D-transpeptidase family protein n=1 Tax=Allosphingosinicella sp. TaxID=2823234 RepID=UPI002EE6542F